MLKSGDFADLVTYLTSLFSIKKIRMIQVDAYKIKYESSFIINGPDTNEGRTVNEFPDRNEKDRVKSIELKVTGLAPIENVSVTLSWDSVEIHPDIDSKELNYFIDVLDRSTFRYF